MAAPTPQIQQINRARAELARFCKDHNIEMTQEQMHALLKKRGINSEAMSGMLEHNAKTRVDAFVNSIYDSPKLVQNECCEIIKVDALKEVKLGRVKMGDDASKLIKLAKKNGISLDRSTAIYILKHNNGLMLKDEEQIIKVVNKSLKNLKPARRVLKATGKMSGMAVMATGRTAAKLANAGSDVNTLERSATEDSSVSETGEIGGQIAAQAKEVWDLTEPERIKFKEKRIEKKQAEKLARKQAGKETKLDRLGDKVQSIKQKVGDELHRDIKVTRETRVAKDGKVVKKTRVQRGEVNKLWKAKQTGSSKAVAAVKNAQRTAWRNATVQKLKGAGHVAAEGMKSAGAAAAKAAAAAGKAIAAAVAAAVAAVGVWVVVIVIVIVILVVVLLCVLVPIFAVGWGEEEEEWDTLNGVPTYMLANAKYVYNNAWNDTATNLWVNYDHKDNTMPYYTSVTELTEADWKEIFAMYIAYTDANDISIAEDLSSIASLENTTFDITVDDGSAFYKVFTSLHKLYKPNEEGGFNVTLPTPYSSTITNVVFFPVKDATATHAKSELLTGTNGSSTYNSLMSSEYDEWFNTAVTMEPSGAGTAVAETANALVGSGDECCTCCGAGKGAWCNWFVKHCLREAGYTDIGNVFSSCRAATHTLTNGAYTYGEDWGHIPSEHTITSEYGTIYYVGSASAAQEFIDSGITPQPGWIVLYGKYDNNPKEVMQHVGIIYSWDSSNSSFVAIEGNTGSTDWTKSKVMMKNPRSIVGGASSETGRNRNTMFLFAPAYPATEEVESYVSAMDTALSNGTFPSDYNAFAAYVENQISSQMSLAASNPTILADRTTFIGVYRFIEDSLRRVS